MPAAYLIDTNIASYLIRGNYPAVREHVVQTAPELLAISAVTEAELNHWVLCRPGSPRVRIGVADFLARVPSLPWDSAAAQLFADTRDALKRKGRVLGTQDLMIAAHALSLNLTLITHDQAFGFVEGLKTKDWTVA